MRWLVYLLFASRMMAFNFDPEIDGLKRSAESGDAEKINSALWSLQVAIGQKVYADQSPRDSPSPLKMANREEARTALEPAKSLLLDLTTSQAPGVASNATALLSYAKGDQTVYERLKANFLDAAEPNFSATSFQTLYQLGLADEDLRQEVVRRMEGFASSDEKERERAYALLRFADYFPLSEGEAVYRRILQGNGSTSLKRLAAGALQQMGGAARNSLPDLERELADLRRSNADFRDILCFEQAIRVIKAQAGNTVALPTTAASSNPIGKQVSSDSLSEKESHGLEKQKKRSWLRLLCVCGVVIGTTWLIFELVRRKN